MIGLLINVKTREEELQRVDAVTEFKPSAGKLARRRNSTAFLALFHFRFVSGYVHIAVGFSESLGQISPSDDRQTHEGNHILYFGRDGVEMAEMVKGRIPVLISLA